MNKKIIQLSFLMLLSFAPSQQLQAQDLNSILNLNQDNISKALKEALENGIDKQVVKLTAKDGFLKNELVKIALPQEAQRIDKALRGIGMGAVADQGITALNRAAEEAVKEATPIFIEAVKNITIKDAKNILLDNNQAATQYLQQATTANLKAKFKPVIENSFAKVGADKVWNTIFSTYNNIPFASEVDVDLASYTTDKTLEGVFKMIGIEEENIRSNFGDSRNSAILKDVFGALDQDKKGGNNPAPSKNTDKPRNFLNKILKK